MAATAMDPVVPLKEPEEPITVTPDEIIYHRRVRVWNTPRKTTVSEAGRVFGVSRTTIYRWQRQVETRWPRRVDAQGPPAAGDAEPDAGWVVDELLAEAVVRPTLGARRYADELRMRGFRSRRAACRRS